LRALQGLELAKPEEWSIENPQEEDQTGIDRIDQLMDYKVLHALFTSTKQKGGKVSRIFGRSFFRCSRTWGKLRTCTLALCAADSTLAVSDSDADNKKSLPEAFVEAFENTLFDDNVNYEELTEFTWTSDLPALLKQRQDSRAKRAKQRDIDSHSNSSDEAFRESLKEALTSSECSGNLG
jgi:hypothetical protein